MSRWAVPFWQWLRASLRGQPAPAPAAAGPAVVHYSWWSGWRNPSRRRKTAEPAGAERRESIRYGISLDTSGRLIAALDNDPSQVRVRNISSGGISLILTHSVEPDTVLNVQLLNRPTMALCKVQVRVTYIVEHPSGDWILGGAFIEKLSEADLRALLS